MKLFKRIVILLLCCAATAGCIAMIVRTNRAFPQAEDVAYTKDNPADVEGLIITPTGYQVYTISEYSKSYSSIYSSLDDETKENSRVVIMTYTVQNTTDMVANYKPNYVFVAEELNAHNGITTVGSSSSTYVLLPGETREVKVQAYLGPNQVDPDRFDELETATITLVSSFYPKRTKLVFN